MMWSVAFSYCAKVNVFLGPVIADYTEKLSFGKNLVLAPQILGGFIIFVDDMRSRNSIEELSIAFLREEVNLEKISSW